MNSSDHSARAIGKIFLPTLYVSGLREKARKFSYEIGDPKCDWATAKARLRKKAIRINPGTGLAQSSHKNKTEWSEEQVTMHTATILSSNRFVEKSSTRSKATKIGGTDVQARIIEVKQRSAEKNKLYKLRHARGSRSPSRDSETLYM